MNAHINNDLPFAALDAGLDVRSERCHQDYASMDGALREATPVIRHHVTAIYQPERSTVSHLWGRRIDAEVALRFQRARANSWAAAVALDSAHSTSGRKHVAKLIGDRAALAGMSILDNTREPKRQFEIFRSAENFAAGSPEASAWSQ